MGLLQPWYLQRDERLDEGGGVIFLLEDYIASTDGVLGKEDIQRVQTNI